MWENVSYNYWGYSPLPDYQKHGIDLTGYIAYPVNYHNNWTIFLFQLHIKNTCWHRIVFHNWYGELWMVYLPMEYYDSGSRLKVIKKPLYLHHYSWHWILWWYMMLISKQVVHHSSKWILLFYLSSVIYFLLKIW